MSKARVATDLMEVVQASTSSSVYVSQSVIEAVQATTTLVPIAAANVTSGTAASVSSQATASHTPVANVLYILTVVAKDAASTDRTPTATHSGGLTWVAMTNGHANSSGFTVTTFRAMKASGLSAGTTTIDFGGFSQTILGWSIDSYTNVDTNGVDGAGAVVQAVANGAASGTTGSGTLATFASARNMAAGSFGHNVNEAITVGANFLALGAGQATLLGFKTEFGGNVTTVNASWTTTAVNLSIVYEIRAISGGGPAPVASFGVAVSLDLLEAVQSTSAGVIHVSQDVIEVVFIETENVVAASGGTTSFGYIT